MLTLGIPGGVALATGGMQEGMGIMVLLIIFQIKRNTNEASNKA